MSKIRDNVLRLAELIEGEGCLLFQDNSPSIRLEMCDKDVIEWANNLFGSTIYARKRFKNWKTTYLIVVSGQKAISIMMSIYPLMGQRRKTKIKEIIEKWKQVPLTNHKAKIKNRVVLQEIKDRYKNTKISQSKLALEYGVNQVTISNIINDKNYKYWNA